MKKAMSHISSAIANRDCSLADRAFTTLGLLLTLASAANALAHDAPQSGEVAQGQVTFYVMGDVPYALAEDETLPKQIAELPEDADFVVHLGDIKAGSPPCDEAVYAKVAGMLRQSARPVFIIPGDNEWNDCTDPDSAWQHWDKYFMRFDRHWPHRLPLFRQLEREEHFSFVSGHVLFVGLNIVGGRVHDIAEWKRRHGEGLDWVRRNLQRFGCEVGSLVIFGHAQPNDTHRDFFEPFGKDAKEFKKPILYIHGDGHRWIYDRPFAAQNILRVQVDQGGIAPPVKVVVTDHETAPFQFDRRNGSPVQ